MPAAAPSAPSAPSAARLLLVRHGESTWNAIGRWQGRADPPLSELGQHQARQAGVGAVAHGPFAAVATSTLHRARQTGELIAAHADVELLDPFEDLIERSAGEWEGLIRAEIEERYPNWLAEQRRPPGYEPDAEIVARAERALRAIGERCAGVNVLVVSHGGVINALERRSGEPWRQLTNLEARWFEFGDADTLLPVGDRVHLLAADAPAVETDARYA
ncbi:MAG: histidine phosphatase family protein [Ilumatobacteraceae bacterium]